MANRVGPYVDSFFVDSSEVVYVLFIYERGGGVDQYDKDLKYLRSGWGKYKDILWPEKSDLFGNVYGFTLNTMSQNNHLKKCNLKSLECYKLPLKREKMAIEHWTVDSSGNIYYTREGGQFEVRKLSVSVGKKK